MAGPEWVPCFLYGHALKSFDEGADEIEDEVGPEDEVQYDAGARHGVEGAEVED